MKTYTINITKNDIKQGVKYNPKLCPVALSLKRRKIPFELIFRTSIVKRNRKEINLPAHVSRFIKDFDNGLIPEPIKFTLKI